MWTYNTEKFNHCSSNSAVIHGHCTSLKNMSTVIVSGCYLSHFIKPFLSCFSVQKSPQSSLSHPQISITTHSEKWLQFCNIQPDSKWRIKKPKKNHQLNPTVFLKNCFIENFDSLHHQLPDTNKLILKPDPKPNIFSVYESQKGGKKHALCRDGIIGVSPHFYGLNVWAWSHSNF